jgi:hypothetical protein
MAKRTIQERFEEFDAANPHVYALMIHFMKELLRAGAKRVSPRFLVERVRWEMMTATAPTPVVGWRVARGKPLKINDQFSSRYARKIIADHPKAAKVIEIRELTAP